jgi:hypothetical protein
MKSVGRLYLNRAFAGAVAASLWLGGQTDAAAKSSSSKPSPSPREAFDIALEAYIFAYPLVTMDLIRRAMTNVREPEGRYAPMGQFARVRTFPLASNREVSLPNADTLSVSVWLDVSREPWVLTLPDIRDRYYLFTFMDGWTTVFVSLSKTTTPLGPQKYAITGPGWKGKLPPGVKEYKSPTSTVWMLGRIYCAGTPEDYAAVRALQDQCTATPLSSYGKAYAPPPGEIDPAVNLRKSIGEQLSTLDVGAYLNFFTLLMRANPPYRADASILKRMAKLGLVPGQPFNVATLGPSAVEALQAVPAAAVNTITNWARLETKASDWTARDGWRWTLKTGTYGTDYTQRALMARIGLGVPRPQDMFFAVSTADASGQPYSGNFRYVMHFPPGQAPSAKGFWSLSMYGPDYCFVSNPLCRYTLSARDQLQSNPDGSLDFYIQHHPPGAEKEANWLPAPEEKFGLLLRFYAPSESLLNGSWKIPPVKHVD